MEDAQHMNGYYHLCPKIEHCENNDKKHLFHFVHYCKKGIQCPNIFKPVHCLLNVHHFSASFIASCNNVLHKEENNQVFNPTTVSDHASEVSSSNDPPSNSSNDISTNSGAEHKEEQTEQAIHNSKVPEVNCKAFDFNQNE
jgi:hypothetical protein